MKVFVVHNGTGTYFDLDDDVAFYILDDVQLEYLDADMERLDAPMTYRRKIDGEDVADILTGRS